MYRCLNEIYSLGLYKLNMYFKTAPFVDCFTCEPLQYSIEIFIIIEGFFYGFTW